MQQGLAVAHVEKTSAQPALCIGVGLGGLLNVKLVCDSILDDGKACSTHFTFFEL